MKKINELKVGEVVDLIALIKSIEVYPTVKGTQYGVLMLSDRTGDISAKKWNFYQSDKAVLKTGAVIKLTGKVEEYKGTVSVVINDYQKLDINPEEFSQTAIEPLSKMQDEMNYLIGSIKDDELRNICLDFTKTEKFQNKFWSHPAASSVHHAEKGGLMYHTIRMMREASALANVLEGVNRDFVIAGAFFHDMGKMDEMEPNEVFAGVYTPDCLLGHIYLGAQIIRDYENKGMLDKKKSFLLQHMILAHHGQLEWGSPVTPSTPEALVLHMVDNLDAKLFAIQTEYLKMEKETLSNKKNFCLGGYIFKPE